MKGQLVLLPGTVVLNQDPTRPMAGSVIKPPEGEQPVDGFIWVQWVSGAIELEDPADLTLTAQLIVGREVQP